MASIYDDPFESIRRFQENMNRVLQPYRNVQEQLASINKNFAPLFEKVIAAQNMALSPVLESVQQLQAQFEMVTSSLDSVNLAWASALQESLRQLTTIRIPQVSVPLEIIQQVEQLAREAKELLPVEAHDDLSGSVTVGRPDQGAEDKSKTIWTWDLVFRFLGVLLPMILSYYLSHQDGVQNERMHQEEMIEEKKQTELLEKQYEIEQERLRIETEQLKLDQEREQREMRLEEHYSALLKSIIEHAQIDGFDQPANFVDDQEMNRND